MRERSLVDSHNVDLTLHLEGVAKDETSNTPCGEPAQDEIGPTASSVHTESRRVNASISQLSSSNHDEEAHPLIPTLTCGALSARTPR